MAAIVVPLAGTWIEINFSALDILFTIPSSPSRGRGLKSAHRERIDAADQSSPSRGRGLKFMISEKKGYSDRSSPSRGRGLKFLYFEWGSQHPRRPPRGDVD